MRTIFVVAIGLMIAMSGGATAQTGDLSPEFAPDLAPQEANERIDRFSAELIGELLETLGLRYTVGEGEFGQPEIAVRGTVAAEPTAPVIDGFEVQFFGCDGDGRCDEMSLVSSYQPARPTSLTTVNRFNQGTRFTTAYTGVDGELVLSMDLSAVGGIGRQATMIMIAIYVYNMESFAQAIGYS